MAITSKDIEKLLVCHRYKSPYSFRKFICVPNVSYGFFDDREADLIAVSTSNYITEIEIKISVADLKKDLEKYKFTKDQNPLIKNFYYAMPIAVWNKVKENPPIPEYAGVYVILENNKTIVLERKCIPNKNAVKLSDALLIKLMRLAVIRYWTYKEPKSDT